MTCLNDYRSSAKKPRYNFDNDDNWVCGDELDSPVKTKKSHSCKNKGHLIVSFFRLLYINHLKIMFVVLFH